MKQYDNTESQLAFSFKDQDFMDFLPESAEVQFRSRWTDFNFHDPGVTAYEAFQYSFEDFFYRYNFPITDILQGPTSNAFDEWSLRDLHTFYAVTENDYRRLLAASKHLYNIAVKPVLNANVQPNTVDLICLLNVDVATEPANLSIHKLTHWELELIYNRAVGEYFNRQEGNPTFIREKMKYVDIRAKVTFVPEGVPIEKNQLLRAALEDFLLPNIDCKDYRYVNKNGKEQRDVRNGPVIGDDVQTGIVEESDLQKPSYRKVIVVSELYEVVEGLPFVQSVESIEIALQDGVYQSSILDLGDSTFTKLKTLELNGHKVLYPLRVNKRGLEDYSQPDFTSTTTVNGKYRHLWFSETLQKSFPANYNIGKNLIDQDQVEVENTASFRGFLYFMDQIRADISAQLGNLWNVFTIQLDQPEILDAQIKDEPYYVGISFDAVQSDHLHYSYRSQMETLDAIFEEERLNYLLALNGWGVATDAIIFWNVVGHDPIKNDFLNLVNREISKNSPVNKSLNAVFRSKSLVMLQEKLRVLLQYEEAAVRILEHYLLQPVWEDDRQLNFELTVFLFSRETKRYRYDPKSELGIKARDEKKYYDYVHALVRMLAPAHVVVNVIWKNEKQVDHFDGLLKTAFPPSEVYYLDEKISPQQRFAMTDLRDKWLQIQ